MTHLTNSSLPPQPNAIDRWQRLLSKKTGRPATSNVAILSTLVQDVKEATERAFSQPINQAAITTSSIPALTFQDLNGALEYLGLNSLADKDGYYSDRIVEANGHGLCTDYHDLFDCLDEFEDQPTPTVLSFRSLVISYTGTISPSYGEAFSHFIWDDVQLLILVWGWITCSSG